MIATLERMVKETEQHRVEESLRLEEESRRREQLERRLEEESRLRAETERKLAEALAELERLRGADADAASGPRAAGAFGQSLRCDMLLFECA